MFPLSSSPTDSAHAVTGAELTNSCWSKLMRNGHGVFVHRALLHGRTASRDEASDSWRRLCATAGTVRYGTPGVSVLGRLILERSGSVVLVRCCRGGSLVLRPPGPPRRERQRSVGLAARCAGDAAAVAHKLFDKMHCRELLQKDMSAGHVSMRSPRDGIGT